MIKKYFILFACCVPVNGAKRNIICDLQRSSYVNIPDALYFILTNFKGKSISYIKNQFSKSQEKTIQDYFNFLVDNEYGFFSNTYKEFPEIQMSKYYDPKIISNAIIDYDSNSNFSIKNIIEELSSLLCESVEIRFFSVITKEFLENTLEIIQGSSLRSMSVIIHDSDYLLEEYCLSLADRYPRLNLIIVHSSNKIYDYKEDDVFRLHFTHDAIVSESCCGVVSSSSFVIDTKNFIESLNHNSCLNKKISIDKNGYIKNCPSMTNNYGHIESNTLHDALKEKSFKKYWDITKDSISVCSDCEFRYICQDCRAYKVSSDDLSKPSKCNYNPYE